MSDARATSNEFDVIVVGLGPVGQAAALLLAQRGHRVLAVEKHAVPYPLPRAVHFDPDISRLLDEVGVADYLDEFASATDVYEWQNAARETLIRFSFEKESNQGWPSSSMFNQPGLEERLRTRGADFSERLVVWRGAVVTDLTQDEDSVEVTVEAEDGVRVARGRYLIGADGANSFVREHMNTSTEDLGFFYKWLIVDLVLKTDRVWSPDNLQVCDPARPVSSVSGGPGRRRFEFMLMPGEDETSFDTDENAWKLLEEWDVTPESVELERRALYTFQARWAREWRDNRVFLAGDSAHQVPPFYGQGMVAGMRDSINLAWKLDLVLRGLASDALLDTYGSERGEHVKHTIWMSVELGRVICQLDPDEVAARDQHFLTNGPEPERVLPEAPPERLGFGVFPGGDPTTSPLAGTIGVNGRVRFHNGEVDLLDRRTAGSFVLVVDGAAVTAEELDRVIAQVPAGVDLEAWRVVPKSETPMGREIADESELYLPWLRSGGDIARLTRPDYAVYGEARDLASLLELVQSLEASLTLVPHRVDA